jgi:aspartyl protease family protein
LNKSVRTALLVLGICVVASLALKYGGDVVNPVLRGTPTVPGAEAGDYDAAAVADEPGGGAGVLSIPVSHDGHYYVDAMVGSTIVQFLVDTGASTVALTPDDAERLGLVLNDGDYYARYNTANGQVRVAPIVIESMRVEGNWVYDVDAVVVDAETSISLLGMSYLRRLSNFEMTDRALTFYWN